MPPKRTISKSLTPGVAKGLVDYTKITLASSLYYGILILSESSKGTHPKSLTIVLLAFNLLIFLKILIILFESLVNLKMRLWYLVLKEE